MKWVVEYNEWLHGSEMGHSYNELIKRRLIFSTEQAAKEAAAQLPSNAGTAQDVASPTVFSVPD